jgi:uncharacterized protein (DUF1697 family)
MPKYVAFLRAINVGGHTVKMDHLRSLFEALKFSNVETFIASGNVIFDTKTSDTKALESKIEKHLKQQLGYEVLTFVRSIPELKTIAGYKAFNDKELSNENNTLYVGFLATTPTQEVKEKMASLETVTDAFHLHDREIYWLYRRDAGEMKYYGALLEKALGMKSTVRNVNTIQRLAKKYC